MCKTVSFTLSFKSIYFLSILMILSSACSKENIGPAIEEIPDISVADNGNNGNGSDVEVNFREQYNNSSAVKEYRIFALKAAQAVNFTLEQANETEATLYTKVELGEIYPIKGKKLQADSKDVNGDLISSGVPYIFAVLTVTKDQKELSNVLVLDDEIFQLRSNNQISNHTRELEAGSGSLVMDEADNIFMSDYNIHAALGNDLSENFSIQKIASDGNTSPYSSPYQLLAGNAFDLDNNLYQSVFFSGEILKITSQGETTVLALEGDTPNRPDGIHVDELGNLFVADQKGGRILKITPEGVSTVFAKVSENPRGITADEAGNLYVSHNNSEGTISKITAEGAVSIFASIPVSAPEFYGLNFVMWVGYIVYQEDHLYVASMSNDRIYKIDLEGTISVFAGSGKRGIPRGGALSANLNRPMGLVFSKDGKKLFVSGCTDNVPQHTQYSTPSKVWEIEIVE